MGRTRIMNKSSVLFSLNKLFSYETRSILSLMAVAAKVCYVKEPDQGEESVLQ